MEGLRSRQSQSDGTSTTIPLEKPKERKSSVLLYVILLVTIISIGFLLFRLNSGSTPTTTTTSSISTSSTPESQSLPSKSSKSSTDTNDDFLKRLKTSMNDRLLTKADLKQYDGSDKSKPIYLAIFGEVFDVTKGAQHYSKADKGGYSFFSGIDGSRAFITGEFNEKGLIDDLEGLTEQQVAAVRDWADSTYHKEYKYVGKLIGNFYNEKGEPTPALEKAYVMIAVHAKAEEERKSDERVFPRCNSRWSQQDGGTVWCDGKSGGVDRPWAGYPRVFTKEPGAQSRCACTRQKNLPDDRFKAYEGCDEKSTFCKVPKS